jgi:hypothetical protein
MKGGDPVVQGRDLFSLYPLYANWINATWMTAQVETPSPSGLITELMDPETRMAVADRIVTAPIPMAVR